MTIKDRAYLILEKLGGRATEKNLVDRYIVEYPDYNKDYTDTKKSSKEKIRGTISSVLVKNSQHEKIKIDRTKQPFEYYITNDKLVSVIIQPIGREYLANDFLENYSTRWAEKIEYEKEWLKSENCIVLFVKDKKVFAKGVINKIEKSDNENYPLDYHYDIEEVHNIEYNKIIDFAEKKSGIFRNYEFLDGDKSYKIIQYLQSKKEVYMEDNEADIKLQETIQDIEPIFLEKTKQDAKRPKISNGNIIFPRNLAYAKASLEEANYLCEFDENHQTFISKATKNRYMEAHHLIPLKNQDYFNLSLDIPSNIVSLCPNCHRKVHFGNPREILKMLLEKHENDLELCGLSVSLEDLYAIYGI